mmetsp:Transcript_46150/g.72911  ORF Transcript_46150/g.72911 Transcript_46150/m.72911 type:complete len:106 (-) Transcript_46150:1641-1958(-)
MFRITVRSYALLLPWQCGRAATSGHDMIKTNEKGGTISNMVEAVHTSPNTAYIDAIREKGRRRKSQKAVQLRDEAVNEEISNQCTSALYFSRISNSSFEMFPSPE